MAEWGQSNELETLRTRIKHIYAYIYQSLLLLIVSAHFSPAPFPLSSCAVSDDADMATKQSKAGSRDNAHRNELKIILPNEALLTGQHLIILFSHREQKGMADVFGDHRHVPKGSK